ncbi:hypothetical protein BLOT_013592, partial [Blomia tropicalis]
MVLESARFKQMLHSFLVIKFLSFQILWTFFVRYSTCVNSKDIYYTLPKLVGCLQVRLLNHKYTQNENLFNKTERKLLKGDSMKNKFGLYGKKIQIASLIRDGRVISERI